MVGSARDKGLWLRYSHNAYTVSAGPIKPRMSGVTARMLHFRRVPEVRP